MNTKLKHIQNWAKLAHETKWSVTSLAKRCGVSVSTLQRHFFKQVGKTPKTWLTERRQLHAIELLRNGASIKEAAFRLGYKQQTNFTRKFKEVWGICPSQKSPVTHHVSTQNELK